MDVLDDLSGEATEIHNVNPWITYGLPLHRLREFGVPVKEMDMLDEQKLSFDQLRVVCCSLLGGSINDYPHPELDWKGFSAVVSMKNVPKVWSPVKQKLTSWINMKELAAKYHPSSCSIM